MKIREPDRTEERIKQSKWYGNEEVISDVGKLIRCKDCRYWDDQWEQDKFSKEHHSTMPCIEMATSGDFYCMFGKPKDGEQE